MRSSIVAAVLTAVAGAAAQNVTTGVLGNATVVTNNPPGAVYTATLPDTAFDTAVFPDGGNVKGSVYAVSSPDGTGVMFQVKFSGLPSEGGPFLYHIHDQPVPADGNCNGTQAHLDPFERGETPACDPSAPETCQVGDLSGKHGSVSSDPFAATYTDDFASLAAGAAAFLGNRSFVLHSADKTRITCANFTAVAVGAADGACSAAASASSTSAVMSVPASTGTATPTTGAPVGSNATATFSTPAATSTFVETGAGANVDADANALMFAVGAAVMAFAL